MKISFRGDKDAFVNNTQSTLISLFRGLAALEVAASHLRLQYFPEYSTIVNPSIFFKFFIFITGFAHLAVVIFFVLSGWLVGGAYLRHVRRPAALGAYFIDRISRLWVVLIPSLFLMLFLAATLGTVPDVQSANGNNYSTWTFLGNLVGFQTLLVPTYADNFPLWSLTNETWYYLAFPLLVQIFYVRKTIMVLFLLIALALIGTVVSHDIRLYFLVWCLGVLGSKITISISGKLQWLTLFVLLLAASYFRVAGKVNDLNADSFIQDVLFAVVLIFFLCGVRSYHVDRFFSRFRLRPIAEFLASFSFTLYVVHLPLQRFLANIGFVQSVLPLATDGINGILIYLVFLIAIVLFAYLFHLPFEAQTGRVRRYLKLHLLEKQRGPAVT